MLRAVVVLPVCLALGACQGEVDNRAAKQHIWSREPIVSPAESRAQETIVTDALDVDVQARRRVIEMRFEEVAARLGALTYEASTTVGVGERVNVTESSSIEQARSGEFRVTQKKASGEPLREAIYRDQTLFIKNGRGKVRVQHIVDNQHWVIREEAWQSLATFAGYFGPHFGLRQIGSTSHAGRPALAYRFVIEGEPAPVEIPGTTPKRPVALEGKLVVDQATGVPLKAELTGKLEALGKDVAPETLSLKLDFSVKPADIVPVAVTDPVPMISRHPTDLDPLAFLKQDTRTSTVIGGAKETEEDE